ncbi:CDP-alcohol phosphatidyltransferase [compost metagenome]
MRAEPDSQVLSPTAPDAAGPGWRIAVPAAVTLGSVACAATAAYALVSMGWDPAAGTIAHPSHVMWAAWMILAAEVFDSLDGLVARWLKATSPFGLQLDSLADAMSFGAAPALLVAVAGGGTPWSLAAGLAMVLCAVVRVARYNVEKPPEGAPPLYFKGLATPGAGGAIASWVLLAGYLGGSPWTLGTIDAGLRAQLAQALTAGLPAFGLLIAVLMVSNRRYPDLTKHYARGVKPWWHLVVFAIAVVVAPELALAAFFIGYVLRGLVAGPYAPQRPA